MAENDDCALGAENRANIAGLQKGLDDFRCEMRKAIKEIRDTLLGRPSWTICFLFTGMSSLIVALVVILIQVCKND